MAFSFRQPAAPPADADCFRHLVRAVRKGRQLELVHWTAWRDQVTRGVVDPYHLAAVGNEWYLVAYCHLREEVRMFVPGRIRALAETGQGFDRPPDFMFQLTLNESTALRRQFGTSIGRGGRRYLPRVITEQGVAMLSGVLNSKRAVLVNIEVMRAFVRPRQLLASHAELARKIDALEKKPRNHAASHDRLQGIYRPGYRAGRGPRLSAP
jgi:hypothetical protein